MIDIKRYIEEFENWFGKESAEFWKKENPKIYEVFLYDFVLSRIDPYEVDDFVESWEGEK